MPLGALAPLPIRLGGTPENGVTAKQHARLCADLVAVKRTLPFAVVTLVGTDDIGGYQPNVESVYSQVGVSTTTYTGNTPTYTWQPTTLVLDVGTYYLSWSASFVDAYGVREPVNFKHARATVHGSTAAAAHCAVTANTVTVYVYEQAAGGPALFADQRVTLVVW